VRREQIRHAGDKHVNPDQLRVVRLATREGEQPMREGEGGGTTDGRQRGLDVAADLCRATLATRMRISARLREMLASLCDWRSASSIRSRSAASVRSLSFASTRSRVDRASRRPGRRHGAARGKPLPSGQLAPSW
jgi:hypothetical protein